eukprot:1150796-Pelagomonas_calceolata.AAC.11
MGTSCNNQVGAYSGALPCEATNVICQTLVCASDYLAGFEHGIATWACLQSHLQSACGGNLAGRQGGTLDHPLCLKIVILKM